MSLGIESMSPADIAAVTNNNNGGNDAFGGNNGWWLILLLLVLVGNGGWGFGNGANGGGCANGNTLYPWMNQSEQINGGFRDQMLNSNITSIRDGVNGLTTQICNSTADISSQLCNGFAGTTAAVTNAQNALATQMYGNTIADLERSFASQTATTQGMNAIQSQLAQCCCDNRLATNDLKYTIATENCADREALNNIGRDIIAVVNANTQSIKDQLCQDKIDAKNDEIAQLRQRLYMSDLSASQNAQTAAIQAGQRGLANEIEQYVLPTPRPAYIVQNPNCCAQNFGCGCGCGA